MTLRHGDVVVAVVSDGCSSGRHSELGAGVGARVAAAAAARRAAAGTPLAALPALVVADWGEVLGCLARATSAGEDLCTSLNDAWLATLLVAVARGEDAIVFGVGDGVVIVDGRVTRVAQGDAPDYPAYALCAHLPPPRVLVHHHGRFERLAIATDGADGAEGELCALTQDARLQKNASLLQKRLHVLAASERAPEDDLTVAMLVRVHAEVTPCA